MDTLRYLYIYLQKDMDPQVERTGIALLLKIAQAAANVFVQQQANIALEAMVLNCSSGRVLNPLLNAGLRYDKIGGSKSVNKFSCIQWK